MGCKRKSKKDQVIEVDLVEMIPQFVEVESDEEGGEPIRVPTEFREDYRGAKLRLRLVGSKKTRGWQMRQRAIFLENKKQRIEANAEIKIYDEDDLTQESIEALAAVQTEILETCVAGMLDVEGVGEDDKEGALAEIELIGIEQEAASMAQAVQSLTARQRFRLSRARRGGDAAHPARTDG